MRHQTNTQKLNLNLKPTLMFKNCLASRVCVSVCTTVVHNAAQNSSDNFPSYHADSHRSSDDVCWGEREGGKVRKSLQESVRFGRR